MQITNDKCVYDTSTYESVNWSAYNNNHIYSVFFAIHWNLFVQFANNVIMSLDSFKSDKTINVWFLLYFIFSRELTSFLFVYFRFLAYLIQCKLVISKQLEIAVYNWYCILKNSASFNRKNCVTQQHLLKYLFIFVESSKNNWMNIVSFMSVNVWVRFFFRIQKLFLVSILVMPHWKCQMPIFEWNASHSPAEAFQCQHFKLTEEFFFCPVEKCSSNW